MSDRYAKMLGRLRMTRMRRIIGIGVAVLLFADLARNGYRAYEVYLRLNRYNIPADVFSLVLLLAILALAGVGFLLALGFLLWGMFNSPSNELIVKLWDRVDQLETRLKEMGSEQEPKGDRLKPVP